jgi:hypothetical protein
VVVDFRDTALAESRLSLQVKRSIIISAAVTNTDFRDVIRDSWLTLKKSNFRLGKDRYGAAVGEVAMEKARALISLCEFARESLTPDHFEQRFGPNGNASAVVATVKSDICALLTEVIGVAPSVEQVQQFLRHFVLVQFEFLHEGAIDPPEALNRLQDCLQAGYAAEAPLVWSHLCELARVSAGRSGQFDRARIVAALSHVGHLRVAPSLQADIDKVIAISRAAISDIRDDVGGAVLQRSSLTSTLRDAVSKTRFVRITGLPGTGKSVLLRRQVENDLSTGPVLFLKSDRLEGRGWAGPYRDSE